MTTTCGTCGNDNPARAISANYWVADATEIKFGGRYERRDFCSMECVKAAPKYVAPKKPRAPKQAQRPVIIAGGWEMAARPAKRRP